MTSLEILRNNIVRVRPIPNATTAMENEFRAMLYDAQRKLLLLGNKSSSLFLKYDNGNESVITHDSQGHPLGRLYGITKGAKGNYWICSKDSGLFKMSPDGSGWNIEKYSHRKGDKQSLKLEQSLPGHRRQIRQPLDSHLRRRREHDEDGKRQARIPLSRQRYARLS